MSASQCAIGRAVWLLVLTVALVPAAALAQRGAAASTIPALLVSDIHFEPFWDPAKAVQLNAAPPAAWSAILAAPSAPDRERTFAELQRTCAQKGDDTPYSLLESSLRAMHSAGGKVGFITLSGDLVSHGIACKYKQLFPAATADDYRQFVVKTIAFVMNQLTTAFPGTPVYAALGNNDSGCDDYRLDANSEFLAEAGAAMVAGLPGAERHAALQTIAVGGYYSVPLLPLRNARLLVMDDLFLSVRYKTCAGATDTAPATAQLDWLRQQLTAARHNHEKVWVMGHIPPGYSGPAAAASAPPPMYLSSDDLADTLTEFGDVIQLALFGHTHRDELRLLTAPGTPVALKIVPAITPIGGFPPAFTVAQIDAGSARLADYRVFTDSASVGVADTWSEEYDFAQTYRQPEFDAAAVEKLIAGFQADPAGLERASQSYMDVLYRIAVGSILIKPTWPAYACTLSIQSANAYQNCLATQVKP